MNTQKLKGIPCLVALVLVALVAATCTIPLRGGEEQAKIAEPGSMSPDPLAAKLAECRSVTYEQKDALTECRKAWAEKRRQFLRQDARPPSDSRMPQAGSSLFVAPKDESRVPSGFPSIQQNEKE
ncbi:MAG TPA: putative entry exclusion protein TrbK-alt [Steroidobacteraceae bacterium]|jgi:conjugative transfer region protein TrbK|nr:putative entry exclusion protein TrbK-alt [Steroidobacteraceae bacterium]